ncbi:MAG: hypothetical protein AAF654_10780 [Myxococcota bacterium]
MEFESNTVVDISPRLAIHSTVEFYFSNLDRPKPVRVSPPARRRPESSSWRYAKLSDYFAGSIQIDDRADVVVVRTGRKCSSTLGRLDRVFQDFGGES